MILEEYSYLEPFFVQWKILCLYILILRDKTLYSEIFKLWNKINTISSLVPFKTSKQLSKFIFWDKMQMIRLLWVTKLEKTPFSNLKY